MLVGKTQPRKLKFADKMNPKEYHIKYTTWRENIFDENSFLSKSSIWEFITGSPYKWRFHPKRFDSQTTAMAWGSLVDCLTTSPDTFGDEFAVSPWESFRSKEAQNWKKEQIEAKRNIVTKLQVEEAERAANMLLHRNKDSAAIFADSRSQVPLMMPAGAHPDIKVNLKGLVDLVPSSKYLVDLKTTNDFSKRGFEATIAKFGYHVQAGMYLSMWNFMNPDDQRNNFKIIWQDSKSPYEVAVTELGLADINHGKDVALSAIKEMQYCAEKNYWPMKYEHENLMLQLPLWAIEEEH